MIRKKKTPTPSRRPDLLTEAVINIPDGMSITDWLHELEEAAIKAVAAVLPPAEVDERGRFPEQWLRMIDAKPDEVLVCVSRWGCRQLDNFQTHFRVPFTAGEDGVFAMAAPIEVEVEYRAVYTDLADGDDVAVAEATPAAAPPAASEEIAEAIVGLRTKKTGAVALAESVLCKHSGKHVLARDLAIALSQARSA